MRNCTRCSSSTNKFPRQGTKCQKCVNELGYAQKAVKHAVTRSFIQKVKSEPCMDCGVSYPSYVMDFDHRPDEIKLFDISKYQRMNRNLEQVQAEIAKCDLVCANCHRVRTFTRLLEKNMVY